MKVIRELGSERRETVRFLSTVYFLKNFKQPCLVREDRDGNTACEGAVCTFCKYLGNTSMLRSYVFLALNY